MLILKISKDEEGRPFALMQHLYEGEAYLITVRKRGEQLEVPDIKHVATDGKGEPYLSLFKRETAMWRKFADEAKRQIKGAL